jgi:hypothetical protein
VPSPLSACFIFEHSAVCLRVARWGAPLFQRGDRACSCFPPPRFFLPASSFLQLESESKQLSIVRENLEQALVDAQLQHKKDIAASKKEVAAVEADKERLESMLTDLQKEVEVRAS